MSVLPFNPRRHLPIPERLDRIESALLEILDELRDIRARFDGE